MTKEKLEQLGWFIREDEYEYMFTNDKRLDYNSYNKLSKKIDFSLNDLIDINELQLILDYIKEQKNDK